MTIPQLVVGFAALAAGCATAPAPVPCSERNFSCRGRQPSVPLQIRELPDSQALIYPLAEWLSPEQVAQTLCEQVLSPFGSASVVGSAVSVQDAVGAQEAARELLRSVAALPVPKSDVKITGGQRAVCSQHGFSCRGRQLDDATKALTLDDPLTLVYPIATDIQAEQVANTLCVQVLSPLGSASVIGNGVAVQDTPGIHERARQLFLNVDKISSPKQ